MSNLIKLSAERLRKLEPEIRAALEVGPNEADTRLKVLDRFLFEVVDCSGTLRSKRSRLRSLATSTTS
jgi:hypothetical protein